MSTNTSSVQQTASQLAADTTQNVGDAIKATQRATNHAMDTLSDRVKEAGDHAAPVISRFAAQADALTRKTVEAVRDGSKRARVQATNAANSTVGYIKEEPVKSVLIAAAAGAALFAIARFMTRDRDRS